MDFSSRSGGTDERPVAAYMSSKTGDNRSKTVSVVFLMRRSGWSAGTRSSGDIRHSIDDCLVSRPRMTSVDHISRAMSIRRTGTLSANTSIFSNLLGQSC